MQNLPHLERIFRCTENCIFPINRLLTLVRNFLFIVNFVSSSSPPRISNVRRITSMLRSTHTHTDKSNDIMLYNRFPLTRCKPARSNTSWTLKTFECFSPRFTRTRISRRIIFFALLLSAAVASRVIWNINRYLFDCMAQQRVIAQRGKNIGIVHCNTAKEREATTEESIVFIIWFLKFERIRRVFEWSEREFFCAATRFSAT